MLRCWLVVFYQLFEQGQAIFLCQCSELFDCFVCFHSFIIIKLLNNNATPFALTPCPVANFGFTTLLFVMSDITAEPWMVVPCYNEAGRLDELELAQLARHCRILLVDDGSTDNTAALLQDLAAASNGIMQVLELQSNLGKGEAVRMGMRYCIDQGATEVGFTDADFATPASDLIWLHDTLLGNDDLMVVLGARWARLGAVVRRNQARHYVGRVFATFASMMLRMAVYDTQCGAKWFRVSPTLEAALNDAFISRWAFDVELIGRLAYGVQQQPGYDAGAFTEVALETWVDKPGSKIRTQDKIKVPFELLQIALYLNKLRRASKN